MTVGELHDRICTQFGLSRAATLHVAKGGQLKDPSATLQAVGLKSGKALMVVGHPERATPEPAVAPTVERPPPAAAPPARCAPLDTCALRVAEAQRQWQELQVAVAAARSEGVADLSALFARRLLAFNGLVNVMTDLDGLKQRSPRAGGGVCGIDWEVATARRTMTPIGAVCCCVTARSFWIKLTASRRNCCARTTRSPENGDVSHVAKDAAPLLRGSRRERALV